ncbi:MAG: hypothetical protein AB7T31_07465 [Gemmatimonadales bacterium]
MSEPSDLPATGHLQTRRPWVRDGLSAAIAGYVSSVIVYTIVDLTLEHSLFFAARTLGADILGAGRAAAHPFLTILTYDGIRFLVVAAVGLLMSAAIRLSWTLPRLSVLAVVGGVLVLVMSEGVLLLVARPVSAVHFWWVVVAANLVAGLAMALVVVHRFLLRQLQEIGRRMG